MTLTNHQKTLGNRTFPDDGLWLVDPELARFLNRNFPKPIQINHETDPRQWKYLKQDVDPYYKKVFVFLEKRILAFRVRFPDHNQTIVEPSGGLVARLWCFLEEAAIKGETSIAALLDRLEADLTNGSPFDPESLDFAVRSVLIRAIYWSLDRLSWIVRPFSNRLADRLATWLFIAASGGKTGTFVPRV